MLVLLVALLPRVAMLAGVGAARESLLTSDSRDYLRLARTLAQAGRYGPADQPELFRTPGYPVFLWAVNGGTLAGDAVRAPVLAQCLLDVLTAGLVYALGCRLGGARLGISSGLLYALTPLTIAASGRVLSETLYTFLFMIVLLLLVRVLQGARRPGVLLALAGGVLGMACLVRGVALAMAVVIALGLLIALRRRVRALLFVGVFVLTISPWVLRNAIVADYAGYSTFATDSLYYFSAPQTLAAVHDTDWQEESRALRAQERKVLPPSATAGQVARYRAARAWEVVASHPWTYAGIHARGTVGFALPGATDLLENLGLAEGQRGTLMVLREQGVWPAARHYFRGNRLAMALALPMVLLFLAKALGVTVWLAARCRRRMPATLWLLLVIVATTTLLGGPASTPRFRVPVEPILCIAAAAGWGVLLHRRKRTPQDG
jgi:4-amino-4-deoxy-L-arabinose transferase-like glycosyltransferase